MIGHSQKDLVIPLDVPLASFRSRNDDRKAVPDVKEKENANATRITVRCAGGIGDVAVDFARMGQEPKPLVLR